MNEEQYDFLEKSLLAMVERPQSLDDLYSLLDVLSNVFARSVALSALATGNMGEISEVFAFVRRLSVEDFNYYRLKRHQGVAH